MSSSQEEWFSTCAVCGIKVPFTYQMCRKYYCEREFFFLSQDKEPEQKSKKRKRSLILSQDSNISSGDNSENDHEYDVKSSSDENKEDKFDLSEYLNETDSPDINFLKTKNVQINVTWVKKVEYTYKNKKVSISTKYLDKSTQTS